MQRTILLLEIVVLGFVGGCAGQRPPPRTLENEPFLDSYCAELDKSTFDSATATMPDREIKDRAGTVLAKFERVTVTVIRTVDIPDRPAWLCTLSGILTATGYRSVEGGGVDGLQFEVILRNEANGETGSWITPEVFTVTCGNSAQVRSSHRFEYNIITPSARACIDTSIVGWLKCP